MGIYRIYECTCDRCTRTLHLVAPRGFRYVEETLRRHHGWTVGRGRKLTCDECQGKGNGDE